jgi:hypothetical protein
MAAIFRRYSVFAVELEGRPSRRHFTFVKLGRANITHLSQIVTAAPFILFVRSIT